MPSTLPCPVRRKPRSWKTSTLCGLIPPSGWFAARKNKDTAANSSEATGRGKKAINRGDNSVEDLPQICPLCKRRFAAHFRLENFHSLASPPRTSFYSSAGTDSSKMSAFNWKRRVIPQKPHESRYKRSPRLDVEKVGVSE